MTKLTTMRQAISEHVLNGASIALGLQMEQMIPFAAGHEIMRQKKRNLRLIGPISDILFDQLIGAVCEAPLGAHPSPVQGYYKRDDSFFRQYHEESKTAAAFESWAERWVYGVKDRDGYAKLLGEERVESLGVKQHAYAAQTDYGY